MILVCNPNFPTTRLLCTQLYNMLINMIREKILQKKKSLQLEQLWSNVMIIDICRRNENKLSFVANIT